MYVEHIAWINKCWFPGEKKKIRIFRKIPIAHTWGHICKDNGYTDSSHDNLANMVKKQIYKTSI